jgi:hypothetical protein
VDWFTVHGSLRDHPKWMALSPVGRGAWITLMTIAHGQPGSKRWTLFPRPHVEALLRREGFSDPSPVVDELLSAGLVDERRGVLAMHDASDHQRFLSDTPERRTERSRRSKAKAKEAVRTAGTAGNGRERDGAAGNGDRQTDIQTGQDSPAPAKAGNGLDPDLQTNDLYKLYRALKGGAPSRKDQRWMDDLTVQEGEGEAGRRAVAEMMRQWPGTGDLLGWTSAKLRGGRT